MIINIPAIITLVLAVLISETLFATIPASAEEKRIFLTLGITFILALITELIGLAPRLFYLMPLWMAALILLGIEVHARYGVPGIVGLLVGGAALQALMFVVAAFHERRRERRDLSRSLRSVDLRGLNPAYDQAWDALHEAVFTPRVIPWTRELLEHDHKVAACVERWLAARYSDFPGADRLRRLVVAYAEGAASPEKVNAAALRHESEWLQSIIRNRESLTSMPTTRAEARGSGGRAG